MKKKTITVRAVRDGIPCPTEGRTRVRLYEHKAATKTAPAIMRDRHCIYRDVPVTVQSSRYYRRRIVAGDLELVESKTKEKG